jgi:3-hydroxybutyryl-CoA dehydrogenase
MDIRNVAVIGAGTMGNGIAQVFAASGRNVTLIDTVPAALERALAGIEKSVRRFAEKSGGDPSKTWTDVRARITTAPDVSGCAKADLVVEAIVENRDVKTKLFAELDRICRPEAILASNTSSISITVIGAATQRPGQVIGMHFMNPVPLM